MPNRATRDPTASDWSIFDSELLALQILSNHLKKKTNYDRHLWHVMIQTEKMVSSTNNQNGLLH